MAIRCDVSVLALARPSASSTLAAMSCAVLLAAPCRKRAAAESRSPTRSICVSDEDSFTRRGTTSRLMSAKLQPMKPSMKPNCAGVYPSRSRTHTPHVDV